MRISVKLSGALRRFLPPGQASFELTLPEDATAPDVIRAMGVPDGEVGLVVVNGNVASDDAMLHDGDVLELLAVMAGG